jgi:hypothetical protein
MDFKPDRLFYERIYIRREIYGRRAVCRLADCDGNNAYLLCQEVFKKMTNPVRLTRGGAFLSFT